MRAIYEYDDIIAINRQMRSAKEYIKVVSSCNLPVMLLRRDRYRQRDVLHTQSTIAASDVLRRFFLRTVQQHRRLFWRRFCLVPESKGILELADGGTVFLDEIDGMPPYLQYKLLRVLQNGALYAAEPERPLADWMSRSLHLSAETRNSA